MEKSTRQLTPYYDIKTTYAHERRNQNYTQFLKHFSGSRKNLPLPQFEDSFEWLVIFSFSFQFSNFQVVCDMALARLANGTS